jgi:hypothetical protein
MNTKKYFTLVPIFSALIIGILWGSYTIKSNRIIVQESTTGISLRLGSEWITGSVDSNNGSSFLNTTDSRVYMKVRSLNNYQLGIVSGHMIFNKSNFNNFSLLSQYNFPVKGTEHIRFDFTFENEGHTYQASEIIIERNKELILVGIYYPSGFISCLECDVEKILKSIIL